MRGFFANTAWAVDREPDPILPACGKCQLHRHCKSPFMQPTGGGRRRVLILAEGPGEVEDSKGVQLVGNTGYELTKILQQLGVDMRQDCFLHNAIVCRAMDGAGRNRQPTPDEISHCRPNLKKALDELRPDVVIPMGESAVRSILPLIWKDGEIKDVTRWVGHRIPVCKTNTWICPTYHPAWILHEEDPVKRLIVGRHLRAAFALKGKPWPKGPPDYESRVRIEYNPARAAAALRDFIQRGKTIALDYETDRLKPDHKAAKIVSCAVSDGETAVSYPWVGEAITATKELIQSPIGKVAANCSFEERWTRAKLGVPVRNWVWDTMLAAHWLDCRGGVTSLKFQAFVLLGVPDYDTLIEPYRESPKELGANAPNRMAEVDLEVLLRYGAMDALYEMLVAQIQMKKLPAKEVTSSSLERPYLHP